MQITLDYIIFCKMIRSDLKKIKAQISDYVEKDKITTRTQVF